MPHQLTAHAAKLKELGLAIDPAALTDPDLRRALRRREPRRMLRVVRVPGRARRDEPSLRDRRAPAQQHAVAEPARERLPRQDARRGEEQRTAGAHLRHARRHGRHAEGDGRHHEARRRSPALQDHREAPEGARRRLREGPRRPALQRRELLRGRAVLPDRAARDPRRASRVGAAVGRRQLRRRDRQLALAAPHGRRLALPRVRRQGRAARRFLARQRAVSPAALPAHREGAAARERSRVRRRAIPRAPRRSRRAARSTRRSRGCTRAARSSTRTTWRASPR